MLFLGGTGYTCKGIGEGVSHNETYRSPLESRVEFRPPCEVAASEFRGVRCFSSEFCVCRLLATQYLPRITPHEMQYLKDSISAYTEIYGIAHLHFQQSPLSVFFGKNPGRTARDPFFFFFFSPCENSSVYTVKCISRHTKRLACLLSKGCMLQVLYSSLVSTVAGWWDNRIILKF